VILPGYYPDLTRAVYDTIEAVNYSTAKHALRSMAHYHYAMENPTEQSNAMRLGHATHLAVFEPARFEAETVRGEKFDRRTKAGKEGFAAFAAGCAGRTILDPDDLDAISGMVAGLAANPAAAGLLALPGHSEPTCVWVDPETGLLCKCRLDRYAHAARMILELKTTRDASPAGFAREVNTHAYWLQAAWQLAGIKATRGEDAGFAWLAVDNTPPYLPSIHEPSDDLLTCGFSAMRNILKAIAEARKSGVWTGYPSGINTIEPKPWIMTEANQHAAAAAEGNTDDHAF
jgi:hypothetical protein